MSALGAVVGAEQVLVDQGLTEAYGTDWTRRWASVPEAVVRPADTAEVSDVLRVCGEHGVAVIPQGGNTGLVGGSVPRSGGRPAVVLSTRRLTRLDAVDVGPRQVVAGAGVTLAELQRTAREAGLRYGVDLAARESATVGGTVATNAGGLRVVAFGDTRRQVVGVEAVLADGSVVSRLGGLAKDNAGYDLSQLMVGSEGTLGVVTAVRLRLLAPAEPAQVVLVGLPDVAAALPWLHVPHLTAAEVMLDPGLRLVERVTDLPHPLAARHPVALLLEVEGDLPEELAELDTAVGADLWAYRERHTEAVATRGRVHKLDVAVPVAAVPALVAGLDEVLDGALTRPAEGREAYVFGHLGDGNLHVNVVRPPAGDDPAEASALEDLVYPLVVRLGGTVAAEHGVGVAKTRWLSQSRTPAEIAAMRAVKHALDPDDLLNPGVLLP